MRTQKSPPKVKTTNDRRGHYTGEDTHRLTKLLCVSITHKMNSFTCPRFHWVGECCIGTKTIFVSLPNKEDRAKEGCSTGASQREGSGSEIRDMRERERERESNMQH